MHPSGVPRAKRPRRQGVEARNPDRAIEGGVRERVGGERPGVLAGQMPAGGAEAADRGQQTVSLMSRGLKATPTSPDARRTPV